MPTKGLICSILGIIVSIFVAALYKVMKDLYIVVPEPPDIAEKLRRLPIPTISAEEIQALRDDGVLFLKGLVKDHDLLRQLRRLLQHHAGMKFEATILNHKTWLYNGAARALLRDGPMGAVLAQILGRDKFLKVHESPIWAWDARHWPTPNGWHADGRAGGSSMLSIWLVTTTGPLPLEFLLGSHHHRKEMEEDCAKPVPGGKAGFKQYEDSCIKTWYSTLEKGLGFNKTALFGPDLDAGDAYIFGGDTLHRGYRQRYPRLAFSFRVGWSHEYHRNVQCDPFNPLLYAPVASMLKRDFDCSPWALLPGLPRRTPWLPAGKVSNAVLQLLTPFQ